MKRIILFLFVWVIFSINSYGAVYWASTNGTACCGTLAQPWDLRTAFGKTATIVGGDFLELKGGAYTNAPEHYVNGGNEGDIFQVLISGTYGNPITIESATNEWAIVDGQAFGGFYAYHANARPTIMVGSSAGNATNGWYITWRNMEVLSSSQEARSSPDDSSFPTSITRSDGMYFFGRSNIVHNIIIHDLTTGFSAWEQSSDILISGSLAYNNGWVGTPNKHGHGVYTQNKTPRGPKVFYNNVIINNGDNSIQAYGSGGAEVEHYRIHNNGLIGNRLRVGGRVNAVQGDNIIATNFIFNTDLDFIYFTTTNASDIYVYNNIVGNGGTQGGSWTNATFTNNTLINPASATLFDLVPTNGTAIPTAWTVDFNKYYYTPTGNQLFRIEGLAPKTFANWKTATGWDLNSTITALPAPDFKTVQPNMFDSNKANAFVYNWSLANSVALNVASCGWGPSDSIRVRNAQDYWNDVTTNVLIANILTLNMQTNAHTVAQPYGTVTNFGVMTFPQFGAFMLEKISTPAPSTGTNTINAVTGRFNILTN